MTIAFPGIGPSVQASRCGGAQVYVERNVIKHLCIYYCMHSWSTLFDWTSKYMLGAEIKWCMCGEWFFDWNIKGGDVKAYVVYRVQTKRMNHHYLTAGGRNSDIIVCNFGGIVTYSNWVKQIFISAVWLRFFYWKMYIKVSRFMIIIQTISGWFV